MNPHSTEEALAQQYAETLRRSGETIQSYATPEERDRIKRAGQRAGELLDRPVRTLDRDGRILVLLRDWGNNPLEHHLDDARARNAIDRAFNAHPDQ